MSAGHAGATRRPRAKQHRPGAAHSRVRALVAAALLLIAGCSAPELPLRVATIHWIGYQPLHLAQSLGYFGNRQVRLADYYSNTESLRAFRNGDVEVAALTLDEALLLRADGHDARVVLILDYSEGADAIVARPGIRDLASLKGRRVGVESTAAGAYMLARSLEFAELGSADIEIVKLSAGAQEQAYREGRVDALVTYEPMRTRLLKLGGQELINSRRIPGEIIDVLVTRSDVVAARAPALTALIDGWFRAVAYAKANPGDAAERLAPRVDLDVEEFRQAVAGMRFPDLAENCRLLSGDAAQLQNTIERLHSLMVRLELIEVTAAPVELIDASLLLRRSCPQARESTSSERRG